MVLLILASHVAWDGRHVPLFPAMGWEEVLLFAWAGLKSQSSQSQSPPKKLGLQVWAMHLPWNLNNVWRPSIHLLPWGEPWWSKMVERIWILVLVENNTYSELLLFRQDNVLFANLSDY
jgi:hypothetical protein